MAAVLRRIALAHEAREEEAMRHPMDVPRVVGGDYGQHALASPSEGGGGGGVSGLAATNGAAESSSSGDYVAVRSIVSRWRAEEDVTMDALAAVDGYLRRLRIQQQRQGDGADGLLPSHAAGGRAYVSFLGCNTQPFSVPSSFEEDIVVPMTRLLTLASLGAVRSLTAEQEGEEGVGGGASSSSSVLTAGANAPLRRLFQLYAYRVVPLVVATMPCGDGDGVHDIGTCSAGGWTSDALAHAALCGGAGEECPRIIRLLQPMLVGVEHLVKAVSFHGDDIARRSDLGFMQRARKLFALIGEQLPSVESFACLFKVRHGDGHNEGGATSAASPSGGGFGRPPPPAVALSAHSIVVALYCHSVDGLLARGLLPAAAADPLGVGVLGVYDAFIAFARSTLADPPEAFVAAATGEGASHDHASLRVRYHLPGAGAVLSGGHGDVLSRVLDAAMGRLLSLLVVEEGEGERAQGGAAEAQLRGAESGEPHGPASGATAPLDWRESHLMAACGEPLPSHGLAQAGRVVANVTQTLLVASRIAVVGGTAASAPSHPIAVHGAAFVAKALRLVEDHLTTRLEDCFVADEAPLLAQLRSHLAIHFDCVLAASWGGEWMELFEGPVASSDRAQAALDAVLLCRDRCLRSLIEVFLGFIKGAADCVVDGDSVGHQCQLVKASAAPLRRLYGGSSAWRLARMAVGDKAGALCLKRGIDGEGAVAIVAAVFDGTA